MIDRAAVHRDVVATVGQWREAGHRTSAAQPPEAHTELAVALVTDSTAFEVRPGTARFCIVTKLPHVTSQTALACLAARVLAFGVEIAAVRTVPGNATQVAAVLYPAAWRYYSRLPERPSMWRRLAACFDTADFRTIFGRPYSPDLVRPGAAVADANGLRPEQVTRIWEEGRQPITRAVTVQRYGRAAATTILGDDTAYSWFHGPLPVGIHRVAPGLVAFALRHDAIDGGAPTIVLNGHAPGLAQLFGPATRILDVGLPGSGPHIGDVRQWLTGQENRPDRCRPGSLRRDAADGHFPIDSDLAPSSRHNLVHCSDGLVAGLIESRQLMPSFATREDLLTRRLTGRGLTFEEIDSIVCSDPIVQADDHEVPLTEATCGMPVDVCADTVVHLVPPVFGRVNGYADGVRLSTFARAARELTAAAPRHADVHPLTSNRPDPRVWHIDRLPEEYETAGRAAIDAGRVAMVAPAGGTGGRFGGYDAAESHPSRQKSLIRAFELDGRRLCGLDVRLANNRYWAAGKAGRVPMAVMASPTNVHLVTGWLDGAAAADTVTVYQQHGVYRFEEPQVTDRLRHWSDAILRDADGAPSLKPPGSLGTIVCLVLSGISARWQEAGVEFVTVANGDDVGFRLDPALVGFLDLRTDVEAVVVGVPWGYRATGAGSGRLTEIRGDVSGWSIDDEGVPGTPGTAPVFDTGGAICAAGETSIRVVETNGPPDVDGYPLFSTNQFYFRLSALRRMLAGTGARGEVEPVLRLRDGRPFQVERKSVPLGDRRADALQLAQSMNELFALFRTSATAVASRAVGTGGRGSFAPLKRPGDERFGQLVLDSLRQVGDELELG